MRPRGTARALERRRYTALRLLKTGYGHLAVAKRLGVTGRSVLRWQAACNQRGQKGLVRKPSPGRPPKLRKGDQRQLLAMLKDDFLARPHFPLGHPTARNLVRFIRNTFMVRYHPKSVGRVLERLGGVYTPGVGWRYQPNQKPLPKPPPGRPSTPRLSQEQTRRLLTHLDRQLTWLEEAWRSRVRKLDAAYAPRTRIEKDWVADRREAWCTPRILQRLILDELGIHCHLVYLRQFLRQLGWRCYVGFGWLPKDGIKRFTAGLR